MDDDLRLWVVDTSSLIQVRQAGISSRQQAAVFRTLTKLVDADRLIFPRQMREELEWGERDRPDDAALAWVRQTRAKAEREADLTTVSRVLARVPAVVDADSTRDQADPYVIALALDTQELGGVSILSDDRRDHLDGAGSVRKLSLATAAAFWDIPVMPLAGFMLRFP